MKITYFTPALRIAVTLIVVIAALIGARWMWIHYQVEPWTRDGRVRADVVAVSPDVSALVTEVDVNDNQPVKKGQRLFALDRPRFQVALEQAKAAVASQATALAEARREDARNRKLGDLVPAETVDQGAARVAELQAAVAQTKASLDAAQLNLARTVVYAPLDGVVANATLHPGDYLAAGRPALALVDSETLHVDGYFEETKLARIRIGDPVTVNLVGDPRPLKGHVASISPGIEDRERAPSGDLLPNVNPTFSWVRLAQRIPVRIQLDAPPPGASLIAGRTATVTVHPVDKARRTQKVWPW
jgi:multidrug resistance efflux pump